MAQVAPFHSKLDTSVYHTCNTCTLGNNIERENKVPGTGGGVKCHQCAQREKEGRC